MRNIFLFFIVFTFVASLRVNAQTTIWSEDFSSYAEGTGVEGSTGGAIVNIGDYPASVTKWTIDATNASLTASSDYLKTVAGVMEARDVDGTQQPGGSGVGILWTSEDIDISGFSDVSISISVSESGTLEDPDFIKASYKIDSGPITEFGFQNDDFTSATFSITGLSGGTLTIYVEMDNNAGTEYYRFDDVLVQGTAAGSVSNPTNFSASAGSTAFDIDLSWNQNGAGDDVMVAYNTTNTFGTPTDGATYTAGETITGGGTVIYNGAGLSYNHSGLTSNTTYYYKAWSVDGTDTYSSGVETNATTAKEEPSNYPTNFSAVANGSQEIDLSWTDATGGTEPDGYLIKANTSGTFTDPVDGAEEADNTNSNGGTINVSQGTGSYNWTGLSSNTQYYFKIWPYTNSGSHIDYKTDGTVPTANATTATATPEYLFITEVADPGDVYQGRFVEIFNAGNTDINFGTETWYLSRQSNGDPTSWGDIQLTGSIPSGGFYIVAYSTSDFNSAYGFDPDQASGNISGNGDDGYFLYKGGNHSSGTLVDSYGVINEDGTGKAWEYTNSHAERAPGQTQANTTWSSSEWQISSADVADMTPYKWFAATDEQAFTTGLHDFSSQDTAVDIYVNSSSNTSATLYVERHAGLVDNVSGITETNTSYYSWIISTDDNTMTFDIDLRFDLDEFPGAGINDPATSTIYLYHRSAPGAGAFTKLGAMTYDAGTNELRYTGLTSLSEFLFASNNEPLPVELKSFTADLFDLGVKLNWETATEVDNYGFEIERTVDIDPASPNNGYAATGWETIGFVQGHGNSNSPKSYSFVDEEQLSGTVTYRLKQIDTDGTFDYSPEIEVVIGTPKKFRLEQNFPNPFSKGSGGNPSTIIGYSIPEGSFVRLSVFNILGQKVAQLVNERKEAGTYKIKFDAGSLQSGIYFYQITTDKFSEVKKMMLVK